MSAFFTDVVSFLEAHSQLALPLAILAGILQITGYGEYGWLSFKKVVKPHPATWIMFAYGTFTLTLLEWDLDAHWTLLILPVACSIGAISVAFMCIKRMNIPVPKNFRETLATLSSMRQAIKESDATDKAAFLVDILLTLAYVGISIALAFGLISDEQRTMFVLAFLLCSNASTIVSFSPLLRGVLKNPKDEHPLPWMIWSLAYTTLAVTTVMQGQLMSELMIYPALNAVLHGLVGLLALRRKSRRSALAPSFRLADFG